MNAEPLPANPPLLPPAKNAQKPRRLRRLLRLVAGGVGGGVLGFVLGPLVSFSAAPANAPDPLGTLLVLLMIPLALFFAVAVHELGHLVGGWLGGGRFLLLIVGPLSLHRTPGGLRLGWSRSFSFFGGLAACSPPDGPGLPRRIARMVAAGPLATLLLGVAAWGVLQWLPPEIGVGRDGRIFEGFLSFSFIVSVTLLPLTLLPFETNGFKTDGKRLLGLLASGPAAEQEAALLSLAALTRSGVRPRDLPVAKLAGAMALRDRSWGDLAARSLSVQVALDRQDWAGARAELEDVLRDDARLPQITREILRCQYAYLLAAHFHEPAAAQAWLAAAGRCALYPATRLQAEAAWLLAVGRPLEAIAKAQAGRVALAKYSVGFTRDIGAEESLDRLLVQAQAAAGAAGNTALPATSQ